MMAEIAIITRRENEGQGESDGNYLFIECFTPIEHFGGSPTGPRL